MKPPPFAYRRAASLDDALSVLAEDGDDTSVLAGGQSLVPLLNLRLARPQVVLDLNRVAGLDTITTDNGELRIGALTRAKAVERSPEVAARLPVLVDAVRSIAHPQIRARTTIGGNVAHADPASELPAVLVAVEGSVDLASATGTRTVPAAEFFEDVFTTARQSDELVVGVRFPVRDGWRWSFAEVARRHGDYAMAAACVGLRVQDGRVAEARVALAGCGPTPVRVDNAEQALADGGDPTAAEAAVRNDDSVRPPTDIHATAEYRRALAGVLVRRAATAILERAQ